MKTFIKRDLPTNQYNAAVGANNPSASNVFATINDIPTVSSGIWGISNASGVYTYYTTLTLAMAAATAGQTIELFADITTTTTVTIKPSVIISGNGHTYTYSGNTGNVFATTQVVTGTYYFQNITILRANTATSTGAIFAGDGTVFGTSFTIKCSNTQVRYTTTTGTAPIWTTIGAFGVYGATFEGIDVIGNTSGYLFDAVYSVNNIRNSRIENTGTGGGISTANINGGTLIENTYVKTVSGNGIVLNYPNQGDTARGCTVITTSGAGIAGGTAVNCYAFSNSGNAFVSLSAFNCMASTVSGTAYYLSNAWDSTGTSSTGSCINPFGGSPSFYNCTFRTSSAVLASSNAYPAKFYNCSLENAWANPSGHAISLTGAGIEVVNCFISVSDLAANCIRGQASAISVKYSNNSFKGATTPVNANVTQAIVNTQDNQGNILL
jgi:hypothetical protein